LIHRLSVDAGKNFLLAYLVVSQLMITQVFAQTTLGNLSFEPIAKTDLSEISSATFTLIDNGFARKLRPWASTTEFQLDFSEKPNYTGFRFFDIAVGSGKQISTILSEVGQLKISLHTPGKQYDGSHYLVKAGNDGKFVSATEDTNLSLALDSNGIVYGLNKDDLRDRFGKSYPKVYPLFKVKGLDEEKKYSLRVFKGPVSIRDLKIDNESLRSDLGIKNVREGALMVIEEGPDGSKTLIDLYSRRNLLTALLGKEDLLTSLILQLKPGSGSREYQDYRSAIAAIQQQIGEHALAQGNDAAKFDERLLNILASFEGPGSVQAIGSILTQISNDEKARGVVLSELVRKSQLELSQITRTILSSVFEKGELTELLKSTMAKLADQASRSEDMRVGKFKPALEHLVSVFQRNQATNADQLVEVIFTDDMANVISEWANDRPGLSSAEKNLIRVIASRRSDETGAWKASSLLLAGALVELRDALNSFAEANPVVKDSSADKTYSAQFENLFSKIAAIDGVRSEEDLARVLKALHSTIEKDGPTVGLADLLVASQAIQSGNQAYVTYVREAGILTFKHESWIRKMAASPKVKAVNAYLKQFIDVPHGIMFGLMAISASFLTFNESEAFVNATKWVTDVVPVWRETQYIPQLLLTFTLQLSLYFGIHLAFTVGAALQNKPVGWFFNQVGKEGFKWFCFPFGSFFFQKLLGQKNSVYAAKNGILPFTPRGGLQIPSYLASPEAQAEATERVVSTANEANFKRATAESLAYLNAIRVVARESGADLSKIPGEKIRAEWEKFRLTRYRLLLAELNEKLTQAKSKEAPFEINRIAFENEERRIQELEKVEAENIRIRRLGIVVKRRLQSEFSDRKKYDFSQLKMTDRIKQAVANKASELANEYSKSSAFGIWSKEVVGYVRYFVRDKVPGFLNYPLGSFEELGRAMPKANVGQTNLAAWQGDMLTQYIILGIHSGFPFQKEFSPGGAFYEQGLFVRGNPETPESLFAQPNAWLTQADGSRAFSGNEGASLMLLNTHPQEMVSLSFQHLAYIGEANAANLTEVGAGSRVADLYAATTKVPGHEITEGFVGSLKGLLWSSLHVREYNYKRHIQNKFLNIFKLFQPRYLLFSICMVAFTGANPLLAIPAFIFFAGLKYYAYAWPWSPLFLGMDHHSTKIGKRYREFVTVRSALEASLASGKTETAQLAAGELVKIYQKSGRKLPIAEFIRTNGLYRLSNEDLLRLLNYVNTKPAVEKNVSPGLEKFIGFVLGGIPTTIMGITFMILTLSIANPALQIGLGALGLAGYGGLDRMFWAYDLVMKKSGADTLIRRLRTARDLARAESLGLLGSSEEFLKERIQQMTALEKLHADGAIDAAELTTRLLILKETSEKSWSAKAKTTASKSPGFFARCAMGLRHFKHLARK